MTQWGLALKNSQCFMPRLAGCRSKMAKPDLGLKDIGRLMEIRDEQLMLQGDI